jgi:hypothetical protein
MSKHYLDWVYDDGGRKAAGFKGEARDCVCRAVAIATGQDYADVYRDLAEGAGRERRSKGRSARNGIRTNRKWFKDYMARLGWRWVACMGIGTGCTTHLRADELPTGTIIASCSRHVCAVKVWEGTDAHGKTERWGVVLDTHDPRRGGNRCVYGYWMPNAGGQHE